MIAGDRSLKNLGGSGLLEREGGSIKIDAEWCGSVATRSVSIFIDAAEATNHIDPLGHFFLKETARGMPNGECFFNFF